MRDTKQFLTYLNDLKLQVRILQYGSALEGERRYDNSAHLLVKNAKGLFLGYWYTTKIKQSKNFLVISKHLRLSNLKIMPLFFLFIINNFDYCSRTFHKLPYHKSV